MAKVPTAPLNRISPTVEAAPSVVTADPAAFGKRSAKLLSATGTTVANAATMLDANALRFRTRDDNKAVRASVVNFTSRMRTLLHNPEIDKSTGQPIGLMNRQGEGAVGITQTLDEHLTREEKEIRNKLNVRQAVEWDAQYASLKNTYLNSSSTYEAAQFQVAETNTFTASLKSRVELGVSLNPGDAQKGLTHTNPDLINVINKGLVDIDTYASLKGFSAAHIKQAKDEFESSIYVGIIDRIAIDNAGHAEALYEKWKPHIQGGQHAAIEKTLEITSTREISQTVANDLFAVHKFDQPEAFRIARTLAEKGEYTHSVTREVLAISPKAQDEIETRLNSRILQEARIDANAENEMATRMWSFLNGNNFANPDGLPFNSISDLQGLEISVDAGGGETRLVTLDVGALDGRTVTAINKAIIDVRDNKYNVTNQAVLTEFYKLTPDELRAMTGAELMTTYFPHVSRDMFGAMQKQWLDAVNATREKNDTMGTTQNHLEMIGRNFGLRAVTLPPEDVKPDEHLYWNNFYYQARKAIRAESVTKKRELTPEEIDTLVVPMLIEIGRTTGKTGRGLEDYREGSILRQFEGPVLLDVENTYQSLDNIEWQMKIKGKIVWVTGKTGWLGKNNDTLMEVLEEAYEEDNGYEPSHEQLVSHYRRWQDDMLKQGLRWRSELDN